MVWCRSGVLLDVLEVDNKDRASQCARVASSDSHQHGSTTSHDLFLHDRDDDWS